MKIDQIRNNTNYQASFGMSINSSRAKKSIQSVDEAIHSFVNQRTSNLCDLFEKEKSPSGLDKSINSFTSNGASNLCDLYK